MEKLYVRNIPNVSQLDDKGELRVSMEGDEAEAACRPGLWSRFFGKYSCKPELDESLEFATVTLIKHLHPAQSFAELQDRFQEFFWITYRDGFSYKMIPTSDAGWGCMIRVG